jgi:hypothetical protein
MFHICITWGDGKKRRGRGPVFFPAGRKAGIFFRSLFGFGTVEFGIAGNRDRSIDKNNKVW